ncbi:MAG: DUF4249 family protein [Bacteroidetes bacterium]|nr:DUF4249 family protein [Bacteroidota bacterium]
MRKLFCYIVLLILFAGCEKTVDWPLKSQQSSQIVVDGIITSENKIQTVTLSYPVTELNARPDPVTGANILISDEDSVFNFTEQPAGSGIYRSIHPFAAHEGNHYTLFISYKEQVITAKAAMTTPTSFNFLVYLPDDDDNLYHISWVASSFSTEPPAMWEVLLDWSNVTGYENSDTSTTKKRLLFYTLSTLDVSEIFAPQMEKITFPAGTVINERRYSLTPEHAEFIRELLLETQWQGGLFNSVPANVPTNLSRGAIGYFAACGVYSISQTVPQ